MAELIDRKPIIKRVKRFAEYEWNGSRKQAYMEFLDMLTDAPTTTEAEIRAKAEHTYENCHNITCRRKCKAEGYNMAIEEFAERLCVELSEKAGVIKVHGVDFDILTVDGATEILLDLAEQLKEEY